MNNGLSLGTAIPLRIGDSLTVSIAQGKYDLYFHIDVPHDSIVRLRLLNAPKSIIGDVIDSDENYYLYNDDTSKLLDFQFSVVHDGLYVNLYNSPYRTPPSTPFTVVLEEVLTNDINTSFNNPLTLAPDNESTIYYDSNKKAQYVRLNGMIIGQRYTVSIINNDRSASTMNYLFSENRTYLASVTQGRELEITATSESLLLFMMDYFSDITFNVKVDFRWIDESKVTGITIEPSEVSIKVREKARLSAIVSPSTATNKEVTWRSFDTRVATIDSSGLVTGVSVGYTAIYAVTDDGEFTGTAFVYVGILDGTGTEKDPFLVSNSEELKNVNRYPYAYFKQTQDIDLSDVEKWESIGDNRTTFKGVYDGNGYKITNLRSIEDTTKFYMDSTVHHAGLFGYVLGATLKNINIESSEILMRGEYAGTLAGFVGQNSVIENCTVKNSKITSFLAYTGGLVGHVSGFCTVSFSHVSDCTLICGNNIWEENRWYIELPYVGGLIGRLGFDHGRFSGALSYDETSVLKQCSATNIHFEPIDHDYGNVPIFGGLFGYNDICWRVRDCFATGKFKAFLYLDRDSWGGIAGWGRASLIENCYASFSFEGVTRTFLPPPPSEEYIGGVIGRLFSPELGPAINTYYDSTVFNDNDDNADILRGTPRTTSQMIKQGTFIDWDFEKVWRIKEGISYPTLRGMTSEHKESEGQLRAVRLDDLTIVSRFLMMIKKIVNSVDTQGVRFRTSLLIVQERTG